MPEWWHEEGKKVYTVLGSCVERALREGDSEIAIICAAPLAKLAEVEMASYFGYEGAYNFNTAMELSKKAVKLAEREGVPSWMRDNVEEIKRIIREQGFD
jgi:Icc-related predicted phosphoesterase